MSGVTTMQRITRPRARAWPALAVSSVLVSSVLLSGATARPTAAATQASNTSGIACTTDVAGGTNPTFNLTTRAGYISLPDGTTAYTWGFSEGSRPFQHPGPELCVNEGDTVTVILRNAFTTSSPKSAPAVSIIFPGQENVLADGAPSQPVFDGTGALTSLAKPAQPGGGTVTYSFVASRAGTYVYESGGGQRTTGTSLYWSPQIQVRMGLFGALIVRPALGANYAYDRADSQFNPATEYMALLSEIDPYLNSTVLKGTRAYNMDNYHPRYWLINGRGFPDSIADNFASWLPAQPYGSLATIHPTDTNEFLDPPTNSVPNPAFNPLPSITRYLSVGTEDYPFHPHGNNGKVIGRDGAALEGAGGEDMSFDKFSVNIGPGQTWDVLFRWYDAEDYSPDNAVPASEPDLQNLTVGMFYSGSAYLGVQEPMPPGVQTLNECGEFYIIAHNHALHQLTSWGVNMTGPITYTRVDPPLPNSCP
jgi:FtsP/CotA-like multicopper oxidase with cupredoxin domain